jgi:hypothetical protein
MVKAVIPIGVGYGCRHRHAVVRSSTIPPRGLAIAILQTVVRVDAARAVDRSPVAWV